MGNQITSVSNEWATVMSATLGPEIVRVIRQNYHRNGIGGAGFVVSLVEWPEAAETARAAGSRCSVFLAVSFDTDDDAAMCESTAVVNLGQVIEGDIDSAWRGADYVGPAVVAAWRKAEAAHDRALGLPARSEGVAN